MSDTTRTSFCNHTIKPYSDHISMCISKIIHFIVSVNTHSNIHFSIHHMCHYMCFSRYCLQNIPFIQYSIKMVMKIEENIHITFLHFFHIYTVWPNTTVNDVVLLFLRNLLHKTPSFCLMCTHTT